MYRYGQRPRSTRAHVLSYYWMSGEATSVVTYVRTYVSTYVVLILIYTFENDLLVFFFLGFLSVVASSSTKTFKRRSLRNSGGARAFHGHRRHSSHMLGVAYHAGVAALSTHCNTAKVCFALLSSMFREA